MGKKHYTKAELSKRKRANAIIKKIDGASQEAALIPGPYIKNESLRVFEETIQAYQNLKFHFLTEMDKPILEAYADAVAYWRFYKRKKDEALSSLGSGDLIERNVTESGSIQQISVEDAATIAYCEHQIEIYFKRMITAREHLSLSPLQLAKFIKAMQEIEAESQKKKPDPEDPIEAMFGGDFAKKEGEEE